jgi:hypothetical protein
MAETPWNVTLVAPVKSVPVIVTVVPTGPVVGEKEVIIGGAEAVTVKLWELVAVPSGVVTPIGPVAAPEGTAVVVLVFEFAVNVADTPLNVTLVAAMRSVPVIVTDVPTGPLVGENEEIVGAAAQDAGASNHEPGDDCGSGEGRLARMRHGCCLLATYEPDRDQDSALTQ